MRHPAIHLAIFFALVAPAAAATQTFLGDSSGPGGSAISVPLQFVTDEVIVGVQFDVLMSDGDAGSVSGVTPGLDFSFTDHSIEAEPLANGALRVLVSSRSSLPLYSGNLARIAVELSASVPANSRSISLANVVFATRDGSKAGVEVVPHLRVTNPTRGTHSAAGAEIQIEAESADTLAAGTVFEVAFFANGVSIGSDTTAPYATAWTPTEAGNYAITALATSTTGEVRLSEAVPVHIGVSSGFEGWRLANFDEIQRADNTISGAGANPDGDRLNNAGEFGFGGLPLSFDHSPVATEILTDHATGDRYFSFSYWRTIFVSDGDLRIEQSGDLSNWQPAPQSVVELLVVPYGDFEWITILDSRPLGTGEPRLLLRASLQLP